MAKGTWGVEGAVRTSSSTGPTSATRSTREMIAELQAAFTRAPAADERVAVIRAAGPVFCAGLDMKERSAQPMGASPIEAMLHAIETYPLPVVAVVQGDAIAGGNELALHCDLVVASRRARFGMSLAQIGLAPSWFLAKKLLEVAGPVTTRRILLLGDPLPANASTSWASSRTCAEPAELEAVAGAVIERLAANAPLSLRAMKALIVREMAFRDGSPTRTSTRWSSGAPLGGCPGGHGRAPRPPQARLQGALSHGDPHGEAVDRADARGGQGAAWPARRLSAGRRRGRVVYIGFAGGRSLFGLRSELERALRGAARRRRALPLRGQPAVHHAAIWSC